MAEEVWEIRDLGVIWGGESVAEIVPEGDAELVAGFCERQEGIAAVAAGVAAGAATDLAPDDLAPDVVLGSVGVKGDLGTVQDEEQLGLVGVKTFEQAVEGDEAGATLEDPVEPGA
jgi:hypothetical protein